MSRTWRGEDGERPVRRSDLRPCPIQGCTTRIAAHLAMCASHWNLVPGPLKKAVLVAFREARGSAGHLNALDAACRAVESMSRPGEQRLHTDGRAG